MAGDYSRRTFTPTKHYSGVLMQQGRVQLDADWNEQLAIQQHRTETETIDVVGATGVPKKNNGFGISLSSTGSGLTIASGRIYVDGLLCELEQAADYFSQPHHPAPDASFFNNPPTPPTLKDGTYVVYLDAWQHEINFRDDPHIHEVALGEADTTTRQQTVWQVKLLNVATAGLNAVGCQTVFPEWTGLIAPVTGKLNVQTKRTTDPKDPCALPPTTGFRRLENQLYRIEIQTGGARAASTFKWSRDNASVETRIEAIDGAKLTVSDLGRDAVLGFATGQWVEIVDDISTLTSRPNALFQILGIDPDTREITLNGTAIALKIHPNLKLRRWDQASAAIPLPAAGTWVDLEDGIQVLFSNGTYQAGDHWICAARTATGEVEWPPFAVPNLAPIPQLPAGTQHHFSRLALVEVKAGAATVKDCRKLFPPLTEITADDVLFNNTNCQLSQARTVQEAIDLLCQNKQGQGTCTVTAVPGPGWESVFDKIAEGQDAQICFPVGRFPLTKPALIAKKGHLKLNGSGPGTLIVAVESEAGLVFDGCKSVLIRDITVETEHSPKPNAPGRSDLNGAMTFLNCQSVDVEQVNLKCGTSQNRTATCLTVRNPLERPGAVRVLNCDLQVGHQQQGILLVNAANALVENNRLRVHGGVAGPGRQRFIPDQRERAGLRRLLFSKAVSNVDAPIRGNTNAVITFENQRIAFATPSGLKNSWQKLIEANPPRTGATAKEILTHMGKLSDRLVADEAFRKTAPAFEQLVAAVVDKSPAVAAQGITVGGRVANDIRILNNNISGSLQGVHVGLSRERANKEDFDQADTVTIAGNTIDVVLIATAIKQDRHGIFVGHCKSLLIENNNIRLTRLPETEDFPIDGIRVWGRLGDRLMITKNYAAHAGGNQKLSFLVGIHVNPLNNKPGSAQWVVMWNVAPSKQTTVRARNGTDDIAGTNAP